MPLSGNAGSKLQAANTPVGQRPGLVALVADLVVTEVDVGDCTVGLQGVCECLSAKLQAAKTPRAPPGLDTLVPDPVETEVYVGDCTVGLQGICECLSEETRGRN